MSPAGFRYVTCRVHNCSDNTRTTPFAGPIDRGSLTVQDDYVFVKVRLLLGSWKLAGGDVEYKPLWGKWNHSNRKP